MSTNRLFQLMIALGLVLAVALTVREALATTVLTSERDAAAECASLPSRYSIRTEFMKETGTSATYTEDGPTGVDGGLMYLLSAYQTCSRNGELP